VTDYDVLASQLQQHLAILYPEDEPQGIIDAIFAAIGPPVANAQSGSDRKSAAAEASPTAVSGQPTNGAVFPHAVEADEPFSQADCLLISYGDSIIGGSRPALQNLKQFLERQCQDLIRCIHVLPFQPFSSDDGFSVIDYLELRKELGSWQDLEVLASDYKLMVDLVINHVSSESEWFQAYCRGELPDFFIEASPDDDLRDVVRPRTTPLLRPTQTSEGMKYVWCTFSHDQIDLNFANPKVLVEILKVISFYLRKGARAIRLDAIGYLWKRPGTSCIHLPETHEVVRLIRNICQYLAPGTLLITETNVPNQENLTYFGNRNEAHGIYNFSLPPLLVHALLSGESKYLKQWMMSMPPSPDGCFYLNFTASHDGIGMRPAEGLLSDEEQLEMIETIRRHGGLVSTRQAADGSERIYEVNISLFDALQGTIDGPDDLGVERFLCCQTVMMGVEGIPAFYIHSLLASSNDYEYVKKTGRNRSINRHQWDVDELESSLADASSRHALVLKELLRRIEIRSRQPAFHPNATQFTLQLNPEFFAFWRQSRDRSQSIFALHNLTKSTQQLRLADLNLISVDHWTELLSENSLDDHEGEIVVSPYGCLWISNLAVPD
jgi:sucrose phosphorylase